MTQPGAKDTLLPPKSVSLFIWNPGGSEVSIRKITIVVAFLLLLLSAFATAQVNVQQFEGIDAVLSPYSQYTVDPNGAVGTKQFMEWTDSAYQGYDKTTFAPIYSSPMLSDTPFVQNHMSDCYGNSGNGTILFDHLASRWIVAVREGNGTAGYFYCIAVSNTDDLTASGFAWYAYELPLDPVMGTNPEGNNYDPDYPQVGVWPDAYYVSIDMMDPNAWYRIVGVLVCAYDRNNMLSGGTAGTPQCFKYMNPIGGNYLGHSLLPADIEGTNPPPAGAPEMLVSIQNPRFGTTSNKLNLWQFHVDWVNPANSTFSGPTSLKVPTYTPGCYDVETPLNTFCVPEPTSSTTKNYIDSLGDRLMHRFSYRRFLGAVPHDSYLISHTVQVGSGSRSQTGIRWYELWTGAVLRKWGTINPGDSNYRSVPSIAQDKNANMAVGYTLSSSTVHPSIAASYLKLPNGVPTEFSIFSGTADEMNLDHWGGYTSLTVDPVDDCTFWYVDEYYATNQKGAPNWNTRISNFRIPTCK
jgi:hypothetical protein